MDRNLAHRAYRAHRSPRSLSRGLTLIECCIGVSVAGILVASALPSFDASRQKRALEGLAAEVATDLRYVRSEAVVRNEGVRISFYTTAGGAQCYVVHTGDRAQCSCADGGVAQCQGEAQLIKSGYDGARGVALVANVQSMLFTPGNGTTVPGGTVCMATPSGRELRHVVSIMGRVRTCEPRTQGTPCGAC